MKPSRRNPLSTFVPVLALAIAVITPATADDGETIVFSSPTERFSHLASNGEFQELLQALQEDPAAIGVDRAAPLIRDLERYQLNEERRRNERTAEYDRALAAVAKQLKEDNLDDAIISAIEAHSIADEPALVLENPAVKDVVARTEIGAKKAELEENWVEASALFGRLNLLFESDARYTDDVKRVGQHIRILHLYAPDSLHKMQVAWAKAHDEEEPPARVADDETWETRLKGIDADMLRESLQTAARQHIDHEGYGQLLAGSIAPVIAMLDTPDLSETFPSLADKAKVKTLREQLVRMRAELQDPQRKEVKPFEAMSLIDELLSHNQRTVKLPEQVLAYEMTEGALSTLDDFSSMYWPEDVDFLSRSTQGSFTGIGVQISRRNEQLTVVSPLFGTPAQKAGIKAGDVILTVDGKDTASWSLNKAVREITGPPKSEVVLSILRPGKADPMEVRLIRDTIEIQSVKGWGHAEDGGWDFWLDREAGIGYIRLTQFIPQSYDKIREAISEMQEQGELNSLVLDLRHNPGGLLTSAIQVVNLFLNDGPILYTVDGDRNIRSAWNARKRNTYPDMEVVVLINQGSASASEIVSGALQDRGRATVVGTRSYGKGSVQDVYWFPNSRRPKYGLKVTTQHYQLPGGRIIHRTPDAETWGIDPDLAIDVTNQNIAWGLELRQEVDVLRDANRDTVEVEKSKPWVRLGGHEPVDAEADDAKELVEVPVPKPDDILELGLDPQLESALLLLKTRQLAQDGAVARR